MAPSPVTFVICVCLGTMAAVGLIGLSFHLVRGGVSQPIGLMSLRTVQQPLVLEQVFTPATHVVEAPATIAIAPAPARVERQPMFNGRPIRKVRTVQMLVTAYSPDERSCGKWADGKTASGYSVWTNGMKLVAADARLFKFGSILTVPGYHEGQPVPVLDRGGAIKGHRLDVLYPTHEMARQWGARRLNVDVWEYAD